MTATRSREEKQTALTREENMAVRQTLAGMIPMYNANIRNARPGGPMAGEYTTPAAKRKLTKLRRKRDLLVTALGKLRSQAKGAQ